MASIDVKPRVFKNYLLKIGSDNYEKHVNAVTITPATSKKTWKGAAPGASYTDVTVDGYDCAIAYAQDWETTNSLSQYLAANEGKTVSMEFSPLGSGPKFAVSVIIVPGQIGGQVDEFGTATVSLGVNGKPAFTAGTVV